MPDHTGYTQDGTYWTIRKRGKWFIATRLNSGRYDEVERWGEYKSAGAAATAVALQSYQKGLSDGEAMMRAVLQGKLKEIGLIPQPDPEAPEDEA